MNQLSLVTKILFWCFLVDFFAVLVNSSLMGVAHHSVVLPAINVLCQWIHSNSSTLWREDTLKRAELVVCLSIKPLHCSYFNYI